MKHIIIKCIIFCILLTLTGCKEQPLYKDGIFYGESEGYYSIIKVEVEVQHGKINTINILEHNEPEILADIVFEELPPKIIKKNSVEVDVISGATYTSESLLDAVECALEYTDNSEVAPE